MNNDPNVGNDTEEEIEAPIVEDPEKDPDEPETPPSNEEQNPEEEPEPPSPKPEDDPPPPADPPEAVDYEKKFKESSRENQVLAGNERGLKDHIAKLTDTETPTEEELRSRFSNWEVMSDSEQDMARTLLTNEKQQRKDRSERLAFEAETRREKELRRAAATDPRLKNRIEEFLLFCERPSRRTTDAETLVKAFTADLEDDELPPVPATPPKERAGLEPASGGTRSDPKDPSSGMSDEDAEALRKKNPREYARLIKAGIIK